MTTRILLTAAVAATAVTAALLGGAFAGSPPVDAQNAASQPAPTRFFDGFSQGDTAGYVLALERAVAANELRPNTFTLLGLAYQQRARETGDPTFYSRSERALERGLARGEDRYLATTALAALAASRHRFGQALVLARRASRMSPTSAAPYGVQGDALIELGRYSEAFATFDKLVALKPSTSSYARVAYARELLGDTDSSISAMSLAVEAAGSAREPTAWSLVHLGNLYRETGRLARAEAQYTRALARLPQYAPALASLADVQVSRGRLREAARLYRSALERAAVPEYAAGLGDALAAAGSPRAAARAYRRADELERLFVAHGGLNELETALFDLDHDRNLANALARARAGRDRRPSVEGEHVLAWALYKNGRCREARIHSVRALRLGTKDTGAMYHRSLIERCLGNRAAAQAFLARARAINPYFLAGVPAAARG